MKHLKRVARSDVGSISLFSHLPSPYPVYYWIFQVNCLYLLKCLESVSFSSSALLVQALHGLLPELFRYEPLNWRPFALVFQFFIHTAVCLFENAKIKLLENANIFIWGIVSYCIHLFLSYALVTICLFQFIEHGSWFFLPQELCKCSLPTSLYLLSFELSSNDCSLGRSFLINALFVSEGWVWIILSHHLINFASLQWWLNQDLRLILYFQSINIQKIISKA